MAAHPFQELTLPAVRSAASTMSATAFELEDGEHVLMVRGVEGFLIYFDPYGRVLRPYCCVVEGSDLTPENARELRYLQHGEPVTKNAWAWLPLIATDGATSYHITKPNLDGSFVWFIRQVRPLQGIRRTSPNDGALVVDLAGQVAADFNHHVARLSKDAGAA